MPTKFSLKTTQIYDETSFKPFTILLQLDTLGSLILGNLSTNNMKDLDLENSWNNTSKDVLAAKNLRLTYIAQKYPYNVSILLWKKAHFNTYQWT